MQFRRFGDRRINQSSRLQLSFPDVIMIQPSDRLMDDVSQFRGKRPAPMSRPPMPTIKQPFLALRNMFLLLGCAPPITLIGQRTMKAKEKALHFPISQSERWPIVTHASTGSSSAAGLAYEFPTFDRFLLPHRRRISLMIDR